MDDRSPLSGAGHIEEMVQRLGLRGGFDAAYAGTPPWEIGRPQPALQRVAEAGAWRGKMLDVGCGTGEHTLLAARLGLDATGVDTSPAAIHLAAQKAVERGLNARFLVWDALDLGSLGEQFETVVDSGLFHLFGDDDRTRYEASLRAGIAPGGRFFLLCFSDQVPPGPGPRRVRADEIRACFDRGWRIVSLEATRFEATFNPQGVPGWLAVIERLP